MNKQNKKPYTPPVANVKYYSEPLLTETSWGIEGDTGFGHKINEGNPGSIDAKGSIFDNEDEDNTSKSLWSD